MSYIIDISKRDKITHKDISKREGSYNGDISKREGVPLNIDISKRVKINIRTFQNEAKLQ